MLSRIISNSRTHDFWTIQLPNAVESTSVQAAALAAYHAAQIWLGLLSCSRRKRKPLPISFSRMRLDVFGCAPRQSCAPASTAYPARHRLRRRRRPGGGGASQRAEAGNPTSQPLRHHAVPPCGGLRLLPD